MSKKTGICKFCGKEKKLCKAHIIPRFFYKNEKLLLINTDDSYKKILQAGLYDDNILCSDCDGIFSEYENYVKQLLITNIELYKKQNDGIYLIPKGKFDYSKIRLFLIFLLWKASISNEPYWENVSLGKYESKALEVLKGINCHDKYFGFMIMKNQIPLFNNSHINPYPVKYYNVLTHSFFFAGYIIEIIPNFKRFMNGVECDGNRIRRIIAEDNKDLIIMIEKSPNMNGLVDAQNIINKHLSLQRNL